MFVSRSLIAFSASCSWAAMPAVPIHFRIPLPFIFSFLCCLLSVCRLPLLRVVGSIVF